MPDLLPVLQAGGFVARHDQTGILVAPSGFLITVLSIVESTGLRWSISSDNSYTLRVRYMLKEMMSSYKELGVASLGMSGFLTYLETE